MTAAEKRLVSARMDHLRKKPIAGEFDYEHLRRIHESLFRGISDSAGQMRTGEPAQQRDARTGATTPSYATLEPSDYPVFAGIENRWLVVQPNDGTLTYITDQEEAAFEIAHRWREVNELHTFAEGNLEAEAVFFRQIAQQNGWELDIDRLAPEHPASIHAAFMTGNEEYRSNKDVADLESPRLGEVLRGIVSKQEPDVSTGLHRENDQPTASTADRFPGDRQAAADRVARAAERQQRFPELAQLGMYAGVPATVDKILASREAGHTKFPELAPDDSSTDGSRPDEKPVVDSGYQF